MDRTATSLSRHAPYKSGFILGPKIQGGPNCLSAGVGGLVGQSKYSGSMIFSSRILLKELTARFPTIPSL